MIEFNEDLTHFIDTFNNATNNPECFLQVDNSGANTVTTLLKKVYDFVKSVENSKQSAGSALPELIIEDFDEEQIWQELELQNNDKLNKFKSDVNQICTRSDTIVFPLKSTAEVDEEDYEDSTSEKNLNKKKKGRSKLKNDSISEGSDEENFEDSYDSNDESVTEDNQINEKRRKQKPSIVDDEFFKLSEMEEFLLAEEKRDENDGSKDFGINLFEDIPSSNDEEDDINDEEPSHTRYKFKDFFMNPNRQRQESKYKERFMDHDIDSNDDDEKEEAMDEDESEDGPDEIVKEDHFDSEENSIYGTDNEDDDKSGINQGKLSEKQVRFNLSQDSSDSDVDEANFVQDSEETIKSTLDKRKERLTKHIKNLEAEVISEKPWQMKGEISATSRPQNSLLEEVLEFDVASRPAPVMTEKATESLEDIITRRIKDKAWDDVERKVKPVETVNEFKKRLVLDQEKSKLSLAQIYEQEYIKQRDAATSVGLKTEEKEEEELPEHKQIKSMMVSLFAKLNALTNFHYTPAPAAPDLKIVSNLPAVTMEEVAPVTASDAALLAPEEVLGKKPRKLLSKEERTETDKKRERRKKKQWQKIKHKVKATESNNNSIKAMKDIKNSRNVKIGKDVDHKVIKTTSAFFNQLQDKVSSDVSKKTKHSTKQEGVHNAKRLKL